MKFVANIQFVVDSKDFLDVKPTKKDITKLIEEMIDGNADLPDKIDMSISVNII